MKQIILPVGLTPGKNVAPEIDQTDRANLKAAVSRKQSSTQKFRPLAVIIFIIR